MGELDVTTWIVLPTKTKTRPALMRPAFTYHSSPNYSIRLTLSRSTPQKPRKGNPVCHDETMKILNALPAANFEVSPIYKYVKEYDDCMERVEDERKKGKASTLYHLSKYLVQKKNNYKGP